MVSARIGLLVLLPLLLRSTGDVEFPDDIAAAARAASAKGGVPRWPRVLLSMRRGCVGDIQWFVVFLRPLSFSCQKKPVIQGNTN